MCSQPPLRRDDIEYHFKRNLSLINTMPPDLTDIGITGGEPTLLNEKLLDLVCHIKDHNPDILIHILSNGRAFKDINYVKRLSNLGRNNLLFGIPLHSDFSGDHDLITQVKGSFKETMSGLYNLDQYGLDIELRIVINKVNYKRLPKMASYIYRNLPFVRYISFMGLEYTGYSIKNHDLIWIDPVAYQNELEEVVLDLATWGMNVSIFNLPYCLLKESVYEYARKSISDWKVMFLDSCYKCIRRSDCCGLFSTSRKQSDNIAPILI
jgi:His-Xaa-Ser system radical SAM maturase HxsC